MSTKIKVVDVTKINYKIRAVKLVLEIGVVIVCMLHRWGVQNTKLIGFGGT